MVCADTEEEARKQIAPVTIMYTNLAKGILNEPLLSPEKAVERLGGLPQLERYRPGSGTPPKFIAGTDIQVHEQLMSMAEDLSVEEIIIQDMMTDHRARLRSYEILAPLFALKKIKI